MSGCGPLALKGLLAQTLWCTSLVWKLFPPKVPQLENVFEAELILFPFQNSQNRLIELEGGLKIILINPLILQRETEAQGGAAICPKSHPSHVFSSVLEQCS